MWICKSSLKHRDTNNSNHPIHRLSTVQWPLVTPIKSKPRLFQTSCKDRVLRNTNRIKWAAKGSLWVAQWNPCLTVGTNHDPNQNITFPHLKLSKLSNRIKAISIFLPCPGPCKQQASQAQISSNTPITRTLNHWHCLYLIQTTLWVKIRSLK